jgi:hypothetical protein
VALTVYTGSGVHSINLGCHTYSCSKPGRRLAAPGYGNPARSLGVITVNESCPRCVTWFTTPPNNADYPTRPDLAPLDADEITWRDGEMLRSTSLLSNALDQLRAVQAAESTGR